MVRFIINATLWGAVLIRGRHLQEGNPYFDLSINGAALIWDPKLTREYIRYLTTSES